ncbi:MAG: DUF3738 domain-containing protein [Granulicella sp.]
MIKPALRATTISPSNGHGLPAQFLPLAGAAPDTQGPALLEALQKHLGMKIGYARAPLEFMIVDHVERPSEN